MITEHEMLLSEEIKTYYISIDVNRLESTTFFRRLPTKFNLPHNYTKYLGGIGESVLTEVHRKNIQDYLDVNDLEVIPFKVQEEEVQLCEEYYQNKGEKQSVITYLHYQVHVYWDIAVAYKNTMYKPVGVEYFLPSSCKKQQIEFDPVPVPEQVPDFLFWFGVLKVSVSRTGRTPGRRKICTQCTNQGT
jgi:hypothetical protein